MARPVVIAVAITGSVPRKKDNPALPVTPAEQIESTHEAFEAGASLVHIHVRNPDESSSSDPKLFQQVQEGIQQHCPGMIVQFSTGGRGRDPSARGSALYLKPDMASLSTGSVNFPTIVYENHTTLVEDLAAKMKDNGVRPEIEIFDTGHLVLAKWLVEQGLIDNPVLVQLCMGIPWGAPDDIGTLLAIVNNLPESWVFSAFSIGRNQLPYAALAVLAGGNVRVGLEDNLWLGKGELATNGALVERAATIVTNMGARVLSPAEVRAKLKLTKRQ